MSKLTLLFTPEETLTHCTSFEQNPCECQTSALLYDSHEKLFVILTHPTYAPPPIPPNSNLPDLFHHALTIDPATLFFVRAAPIVRLQSEDAQSQCEVRACQEVQAEDQEGFPKEIRGVWRNPQQIVQVLRSRISSLEQKQDRTEPREDKGKVAH